MNIIVYDEVYSQSSHQNVSAAIAAIFRVILLKWYKSTNVVSCVAVTPLHLFCYAVTTTQITPFLLLCLCNNITLKMAAIAVETFWW